MSRVLITGASGFIGQHLVERFNRDGHEVHGLYESRPHAPAAVVHLGNLKDHERIERIVTEVQPEFVVHLAAKTEVALSFDNYLDVSAVNYVGTVNLAEANRKHNPHLRAFLMASTMETYGAQPVGVPFTEDTPQRPMAPYAVAKLACEKYLAYMGASYRFPNVILRQTNAYGRRDNDFFVVERIVSQMLRGDVCNLGAPYPMRNFLFIDDLVDLYSLLLADPDRALGHTFVTGPNNAISIRELARIVADMIGWDGELNWGTLPPRPGEIPYLSSTPRKARDLLGWGPRVDLAEGLARTIDIWRAVDPRCSTRRSS